VERTFFQGVRVLLLLDDLFLDELGQQQHGRADRGTECTYYVYTVKSSTMRAGIILSLE
jgi:hypothetical protein